MYLFQGIYLLSGVHGSFNTCHKCPVCGISNVTWCLQILVLRLRTVILHFVFERAKQIWVAETAVVHPDICKGKVFIYVCLHPVSCMGWAVSFAPMHTLVFLRYLPDGWPDRHQTFGGILWTGVPSGVGTMFWLVGSPGLLVMLFPEVEVAPATPTYTKPPPLPGKLAELSASHFTTTRDVNLIKICIFNCAGKGKRCRLSLTSDFFKCFVRFSTAKTIWYC